MHQEAVTSGEGFERWLRAARRGDDAAWAQIYHELAGPVLGYLRSQGAPDPEDVLGETMLQVVRDIQAFEGDASGFRSWVFTIAHRRLLDARRHRSRRPVDPHEGSTIESGVPPSSAAESEALEGLELASVLELFGRLTDEQREVLLLRLLGDQSVAQTSRTTGRSEDAVKALTKRGLDRLRTLLAERSPGDRPPPTDADER